MCDVTLLASRCHARKQATINTACIEEGALRGISQANAMPPCLFTTQLGGGWARNLD